MINIKKLFNKFERGLRKEKVKVTREGKTFYREQMVGRKSPREGTGKMNKFPDSIKKEILKLRQVGYSGAKIKDQIEDLIDSKESSYKSKLINIGILTPDSDYGKAKLTVTSQALTNWAKTQGIESTKKRTSGIETEKSKHEDTKKELDRSNKKVAQLEVAAKHNLEEIKLVQQSKQESDSIRGELRRDNVSLKEKLKACLSGKK